MLVTALAAVLACAAMGPAAADPAIQSVNKTLMFLTDGANERVGYQYGTDKAVYFDQLAESTAEIDQSVQQVYMIGKDVGALTAQAAVSAAAAADLLALETRLNTLVSGEAVARATDVASLTKALADQKVELIDRMVPLAGEIAAIKARVAILENATSSGGGGGGSGVITSPSAPRWTAVQNTESNLTRARAIAQAPATLQLFGTGFGQYFHPLAPAKQTSQAPEHHDVTCQFSHSTAGQRQSPGEIVTAAGEFFYCLCTMPALVPGVVTVALLDLQGGVIPFAGLAGRNQISIVETWSVLDSNPASGLVIAGFGFQGAASYTFNVKQGTKTQTLTGCSRQSTTRLKCNGALTNYDVNGNGEAEFKLSDISLVDTNSNKPVPNRATILGQSAESVVSVSLCQNGVKDGSETDVDCGSTCATKCATSKICKVNGDCAGGACSAGTCSDGSGKTAQSAGETCQSILKLHPSSPSGTYFIVGLNRLLSTPTRVLCEMTRQGGGWTLGLKTTYNQGFDSAYGSGLGTCSNSDTSCNYMAGAHSIGDINTALNPSTRATFKLADDLINDGLIGTSQKFDVMADQVGFNPTYSTGNVEYVTLVGYTAKFRYDQLTPTSSTPTVMSSYRISDNRLAWTGELKCGTAGGAHPNGKGINCLNVVRSNPGGGRGCSISMGRQTDNGWHHFYMFEHNSDSYLYICNGAQHSSGTSMKHRFWFRQSA